MANLYLVLDNRKPRKDGSGSLKIAITHRRSTVYSPLGIYLKPDEWDVKHQQVVLRPDKKFQNVLIKKRFAEATICLQRIMLRCDINDLTAREVINMINRGTDTADTPEAADYVIPVYNEYITLCRKANTAATYRYSLKSLIAFEPNIDTLRFKDISVSWLRKYQQWLIDDRGMDVNGANVYLRNLRTIFNYAIKNQFTSARYPFRDIDMGTTEPDKRTIPYEKFLEFATVPIAKEDGRALYRDLFMLSFYLCGIRPIDLLSVTKDQVQEGRLVYFPEKLNGKTKLSIKIEPEAWEIIHRHEGDKHLINILDNRTDYRSFCQHWNKGIKTIGHDELCEKKGRNGYRYVGIKYNGIIPYASAYYARSSWASYAYNLLDTPMDTISQALGHKSGLRVTNFYVKRDMERVDKTNRALIDRLNKDMEEFINK